MIFINLTSVLLRSRVSLTNEYLAIEHIPGAQPIPSKDLKGPFLWPSSIA
jgi:hypothetical protein